MCQGFKWLISFGSICGLCYLNELLLVSPKKSSVKSLIYFILWLHLLFNGVVSIQSVLWMGFGLVSALVYLCVIPVPPYTNENDYFRVTIVKLYFEGPQCIPDGSYLGKFNEDYRSSIELFTPDKVFAVMITYVILNAIYFILSILFYKNRKEQDKRRIALSWSLMTLVICAVDFLFTFELIHDIFKLRSYMNKPEPTDVYTSSARGTLTEIPYFPLVLALLSSRFIAFWLWNFLIGVILFLDALCYRKIIGKPFEPEKKLEKKQNEVIKELRQQTEDRATSVSLASGKYYSAFDVRNNPNYLDFKKSVGTVTRFNTIPESSNSHRGSSQSSWGYPTDEVYWHRPKSHLGKEWEITNEGFVSDEPNVIESEKQVDFDHDLKNFESGQRKIKIVKPPIGKPVSIPIPPPLPANGSCDC